MISSLRAWTASSPPAWIGIAMSSSSRRAAAGRTRCGRGSAGSRPASVTSSGSRSGRTGADERRRRCAVPAGGRERGRGRARARDGRRDDQLRRPRPRRRSGRAMAPAATVLPLARAAAIARRRRPRRGAGVAPAASSSARRPAQRCGRGRAEPARGPDAPAAASWRSGIPNAIDDAEDRERRRAGRTRPAP